MRWVLLLLLAGCATASGFRDSMDAWVGRPVDGLVGQMGPPQSVYPLSDGGAVLQWASSRSATIPVPQQTYGSGTVTAVGNTAYWSGQSTAYPSAYHLQFNCTVRVTVGPDGLVKSWNAEGNNCIR